MADNGFRALRNSRTGGAEWYYIGATFVFVGAVTAFTSGGWIVGLLAFLAGIGLLAAGTRSWVRAARRGGTATTATPAAPESPTPKI
jgi:uncharacterized membrane protein